MQLPMSKEARKLRDADFARRLQPRPVWDAATNGTAMRVRGKGYEAVYATKQQPEPKVKKQHTEAEDNAIGRALRRRKNRRLRAARKPHAAR